MSSGVVRTLFPETRLAKLAVRPGGVWRDQAIEEAKKQIGSMQDEGDRFLGEAMASIEALLAGAAGGNLPADKMRAIQQHADRIVTLCGTFGYDALGQVMRSLCDVTDGLLRLDLHDAAPVAVHVRSMRLFAPGAAPLSQQHIDVICAELAKVLAHFQIASIASQAGPEEQQPSDIAK